MINKISLISVIFLLLTGFSYAQKTSDFIDVEVLNVTDGDTIKVNLNCDMDVLCNQMSVRVRGIDTAEMKGKAPCEQKMAKKAKKFTQDFLKEGKVSLLDCERDKYFRLLCEIKVNDKYLSETLINNNLAVAYDGGHKNKVDWCGKVNKEDKEPTFLEAITSLITSLIEDILAFFDI